LLDLLVIGGGQAGLAAAREASVAGKTYRVLDAGRRAGDSWRDRYDSLVLFTPKGYSELAGLQYERSVGEYPTKEEIADYLEQYSSGLYIEHNAEVVSLTRQGDEFTAILADGRAFRSRRVVVATGPFQHPRIPQWSASFASHTVHSSAYRSPLEIPSGRVLVVGGGNSGAQIAEELAVSSRDVTLAVSGPLRFVPERFFGVSVFTLLNWAGFLYAPTGSLRGRLLRRRRDPVFGTGLRRLIANGSVHLRPAAVDAVGSEVRFSDRASAEFDAVVFCTGYSSDYRWLKVEGALDQDGVPAQAHGISSHVTGLGFVGLGWMRSRSSGLVAGASADARFVIRTLFPDG
jgi:putative flavoprotein involved in K+ transport